MANNFIAKDAANSNVTFRSIDNAGVHTVPHVLADAGGTPHSNSYPIPVLHSSNVNVIVVQGIPTGSNVIGGVTQSGTWNIDTITTLPNITITALPGLMPSANIIGKVGIDQTTDGTTNLVAAKQNGTWTISSITANVNVTQAGTWTVRLQDGSGTALATGTGNASSGALRTVTSNNDPLLTLFGAQSDVANAYTNSTSISVMAVLKQLSTSLQSLTATAAADDLILDEGHGVKTSIGTSSGSLIVPPSNCKYVWISSDTDIGIRTDGGTAAASAGTLKIIESIVPVKPGVSVTAICLNGTTASVYAVPLIPRS